MKLSGKLLDRLATLSEVINSDGELFKALTSLAAEDSNEPQAIRDIDEAEITRVIDSWNVPAAGVMDETTAQNVRDQFILLAMIPGMLGLLVQNENLSQRLIRVINQIAPQYFIGFFPVIIKALWGEVNAPRQASNAAVDWLFSLEAFKRLQFLAPSEADSNLVVMVGSGDSYLFERLFAENVLSSNQRSVLFSAMTSLSQYSGNAEVNIALLLLQQDFKLREYLASSSIPFRNLALVKVELESPKMRQIKQLEDLFLHGTAAEKLLDEDTFVSELNTAHTADIKKLTEDQNVATYYARMENLHVLLKQLSPANQDKLVDPNLSLAILKHVQHMYANRLQVRAWFGGKGNIKRDFLSFIIADFVEKLVDGKVAHHKLMVAGGVGGVLWNAYAHVKNKQPTDINEVNTWLKDDILDGYVTKEAIMWLDNHYLVEISKGYEVLTKLLPPQEAASSAVKVSNRMSMRVALGENAKRLRAEEAAAANSTSSLATTGAFAEKGDIVQQNIAQKAAQASIFSSILNRGKK